MAKILMVKLLSQIIGFNTLSKRVHALWKPSQMVYIIDLKNDYYMVKFQSYDDYTKVSIESP
ncbi:hypothetical protein J1N35_002194 [Gossypium stocksii]|uniref:Uncharacterized protein n=1 Tax=Gossypium stocksii TaxID=47602 RepID=A0A9D4AM17_9ROSI|nr:hypothetical protein J1N35_002194 [Gossypium stocksii]